MGKNIKILIGVVVLTTVVVLAVLLIPKVTPHKTGTIPAKELQPHPQTSSPPLQKEAIEKILVNDFKNDQGFVDQHKDIFTPATQAIFVSAYLDQIEKGTTISSELILLDTGEKLGPVTNTISISGSSISNFSFTKPTHDWPVGSYKLIVRLSTGETREIKFLVM